ncbi:FAD-dependent oxidoreductase [Flagellimonas sp. 2504JD4-2]
MIITKDLMEHYDIIIVGTGAGGSTLAYKLARTGKNILVLERGGFLPKEVDNWNPEAVAKGKYRTGEKWVDKNDDEFEPYTHYWVGGNTKMYGAALLRMRESDFEEVEHYGGISPKWPLTYSDFESYYSQAEYLYKVHGQRGLDPTDPPSSTSYPFGALKYESRMKEMANALKDQGLHPSPIPIGVNLPSDNEVVSAKVNLSLFDGYPDPTESKADAHVIALKKALESNNVTLKTDRKVERLETDQSGKNVTNVICTDRMGNEISYSGGIIVLSCGAINSAKVLLGSTSEKHPDGLANSSGLVGRNLMMHNNGTVVAISRKPNESKFQKAFLISDFYHGAEDSKYPLGTIQLMGKTDPVTLKEELQQINPDKEFDLDDVAKHSVDFFITAEDLPDPSNRVILTKEGKIKLVYHPNNTEAYNRLRQKLIGLLGHMDCEEGYCKDNAYVGFKLGVSGVSHQNGTCRFGVDPENSVLDINCKAHDLDNLYVVDGSFFPSSSAVNPSLTIIANALRVGDYLIGHLGSR